VLVLATVLLAACTTGMPQGTTKQGADIRHLYQIIFAIAVVVFVVVDGAILFAVLRYRRRPADDTLPPQIHGNNLLEVIWFLVPFAIVIILYAFSTQTLARVDDVHGSPDLQVDVQGFQWQWTFKYPAYDFQVKGTIDKPPEMVLPVNQTTRITEKSTDVIHSFYVPSWNFKKDIIPGHINEFDVFPDRTGTFSGQCAEFCGLLHNAMTFSVRVLERPEFERWAAEQQEAARRAIEACGEPTDRLVVVARNIAFDDDCLPIRVATPYTIEFDNQDRDLHNVAIYTDESAQDSLLVGETFGGPGKRTYEGTPIDDAGTYFFRCDVHPVMSGTVIVK
jgi:cytochrome c oxidase subunit 2